jgi:16S rRNA (guanine527-N7)-methyltransferase
LLREAHALSLEAIQRPSADLGLQLTDEQAERLLTFAKLLVKWNRVHNLTALTRPEDVLTHHLLDSLSIVPELIRVGGERPLRILDVGAGGGLPGVPIAIARPDAQVTLIDRVQKKTAFLEQARVELALSNIHVHQGRVEDYRAPPFDVIVSRAFAALAEMIQLTSHLLAPGGCWAAMKGVYPTEETNALPSTVTLVDAVKLRVPLLGAERHLVVLRPG